MGIPSINCRSKVLKFHRFILQMAASRRHDIDPWIILGCLLVTKKKFVCRPSLLSLFNNDYVMSTYPFHLQHPLPPLPRRYPPVLCHRKSLGRRNPGTWCRAITNGMYGWWWLMGEKKLPNFEFRNIMRCPNIIATCHTITTHQKKLPLTASSSITDTITFVIILHYYYLRKIYPPVQRS